jgi:3-phenylpropionate/trans-cinnamate dioxygenase ferredoxin reductase subunit
MEKFEYVIVGGGTTAGYAIKELIKQKVEPESILLLSAEKTLPLNRPPLTKSFMRGETKLENILITKNDFLIENPVRAHTNTWVTHVDFENKIVETNTTIKAQYEKLLIATGASPKKLDIPGHEKENVFYIRTVQDATKIKDASMNARKVTVVGAGFIGTELASSFSQMGMEVTLIYPEGFPMARLDHPAINEFFEHTMKSHGIKLKPGRTVEEVMGGEFVKSVKLDNDEIVETDMVVAGIGVTPNTEIFKGSPLNIDDGIIIDEFGRTNIDHVYAAGDVARFTDIRFAKRKRFEHWDNAFRQGKHVAKIMTGYFEEYDYLPYYFSEIFDVEYTLTGDPTEGDLKITKGFPHEGNFGVFWLKNNIMQAAFLTDKRPETESEKSTEWIKNKTILNVDVLQESTIPFEEADI